MIWLTSDPHFGHKLAAESRGFDTVEEHDEALLANYRKQFHPNDEVWWLGDIAFDGWRERLPKTVGTLPGLHHLVLGNRDRAHPLNSRGHAYQREMLETFVSVSTVAQVSFDGAPVMLSHFPYSGDNHTKEDREPAWRLRDEGRLLAHGHTHGAEDLTFSIKGTPQFHVGVDAWELKAVPMWFVVAAFKDAKAAGLW